MSDIHDNRKPETDALVAGLVGQLEHEGVAVPAEQQQIIDAANAESATSRALKAMTPEEMNGVWVCFCKPNGDVVTGGAGKLIKPNLEVQIFARDLVQALDRRIDGPFRFVVALVDWQMRMNRYGAIEVLPGRMCILPNDADGDVNWSVDSDDNDTWEDVFAAGVDHYVAQVNAAWQSVKEWYYDVDLNRSDTVVQAKGQRPNGASPL